MRIVLHVGSNKTGSTAIQDTCDLYRKSLSEAGVLYPKIGKNTHHSELLFAILDDEEYRGNFNRSSAEGRAEGVRKSELFWQELNEQVSIHTPETLLISSEFIFGARPQSIDRLISRLTLISNKIEAVVYLRDPADHYLSSAQQILKYGSSVKNPRETQNYSQKLMKISESLPNGVTWRIFSRGELFKNDVCLDLLNILLPDEKVTHMGIKPVSSNESLSAEAMAIMQNFNQEIWGGRRIVGNKKNKPLLEAIARQEKKINCTKAELKPEIRDIVYQAHLSDLERLDKDFGIAFPKAQIEKIKSDTTSSDQELNRLKVLDIVNYSQEIMEKLIFRVMADLAGR